MSSLTPESSSEGVRLQKVLAQAGYGSRRKCEALIDARRVSVNDELVTEQGRRVIPDVDVVRVDGERIAAPAAVRVFALNKPPGVLSAMSDDRGRPTIGGLLDDFDSTLTGFFHVGRLDQDTTGLILMTNNGQLADLLAHPRHGVSKTYVARVDGHVTPGTIKRLSRGVKIDGRAVEVSHIRMRGTHARTTLVELSIHEGRKRIVRRLFDEVGHPVTELTRTSFGPISVKGLAAGQFRELSEADVARLYDAADSDELAPDTTSR